MAKLFQRIGLSSFFLLLTGCGGTVDKFDWQATESAPEHFPMEIVKGDLFYPDKGSLYVPNGVTLHSGWGKGRSSHIVGPDLKPLPEKLEVIFFSYWENQFYQGSFDLPYQEILAYFKAGYFSPTEKGHTTFDQIVVGVAPGGHVSVWIRGLNRSIEILAGKADKIEGDWAWILDNPDITRSDFLKSQIEYAIDTEAIASIKKNGIPFGLWQTYRKRYAWQPLFTNLPLRDGMINEVVFVNGELDYLNYPASPEESAMTRAIPSRIYFIWQRPNGNRTVELTFDRDEIITAFERLGGNGAPLQLEMEVADTEQGEVLYHRLRNEDKSYTFQKTKVKSFAAN